MAKQEFTSYGYYLTVHGGIRYLFRLVLAYRSRIEAKIPLDLTTLDSAVQVVGRGEIFLTKTGTGYKSKS
jgi:hypothetical protein